MVMRGGPGGGIDRHRAGPQFARARARMRNRGSARHSGSCGVFESSSAARTMRMPSSFQLAVGEPGIRPLCHNRQRRE